ncbi:MAG: DUF1501 domain-containing protein [Planctomycetota bacterium]|nr:MAG: DUF1501 domain-containing protein [Planctomycetota bacterium]REK20342.1 MAG: DUF1501 domain-containing protein [Planctomycetota bacterium]REK26839.1 MAG: DUF1501 domain-containing protein [Planctomycetota bacterium]
MKIPQAGLTRRDCIKTLGAAGAASLAMGRTAACIAAEEPADAPALGSAEHCIFIWLGGGACQIDTFDPKRVTSDGLKDPGSAYPAIDTAIPGVQVCEHLSQTAPLMDRCVPVRTVHHDVIDEHAAAAYRMHTGRPTSGTIVYPSIGSTVSHLKEPAGELVPRYVLMGNPSPSREPGFLGAANGYVYLTETRQGPKGLVRPERVSDARVNRRLDLLKRLRDDFAARHTNEQVIQNYIAASEQGFRLAGPEFLSVFELGAEPDELRNSYGDEFGQRCLLARRLIERGTRFVEVSFNLNFVNGTGWDTHNEGQQNQHLLIQRLDAAFATLLTDLEAKRLLDKTLLVISTEFGRPAQFDGRGGRGHHAKSFSVLLAGGGLKTGQAVGATDELGMQIVDRPVSVPDLFATIYAALGINPHEVLYAGDRPVPVTDMGTPVADLFS